MTMMTVDTNRGQQVARLSSPIGTLVAAANERGIVFLEFDDQANVREALRRATFGSNTAEVDGDAESHLARLTEELAEYFAGERQAFTVPVVPQGTPFELKAWEFLRSIPYGQTRSYGQQARAVGSPAAARAVGRANGRNRIGIVIPCHRVIGADGSLTGFGGGLDRKRWLLEHERNASRQGTR